MNGIRITKCASILRPPVAIIAALLLCAGISSAQVKLASLSVNSGGAAQTSTNYGATLTIGQVASGTSASTSYRAMLGFWHALDLGVGVQNEPSDDLPMRYSLSQNYPNPFNPSTQIAFSLARASDVKIDIYNILGQKVIQLVDKKMGAGSYIADWYGRNAGGRTVASGVYFYRLAAGDFVETKRMVLLK